MGLTTPPTVAARGETALTPGGYRDPPGWTASAISLVARPKNTHMSTSFTRKWSVTSCPWMDSPKSVGCASPPWSSSSAAESARKRCASSSPSPPPPWLAPHQ